MSASPKISRRFLDLTLQMTICALLMTSPITLAQPEVTAPYCEVAGGCDEYISRVTVANIDNQSGCVGYSLFYDEVVYLEIGQSYQITIELGNAYSMDSGGIWIDWGRDYEFDVPADEIPLDVDGGYGPYVGTITVPGYAQPGETWLRVRLCYNQVPQPCGITEYGELEDYPVIISGDPYLCGDASGDGGVSVSDAVYLVNYIFRGGPPPDPFDAGDANCDGSISVADAVYLIQYIFAGGPEPCCPAR